MSDCDCQHFAYWKEGRAVMIQCETCKEYMYAKSQYHAQDWANKHAGRAG